MTDDIVTAKKVILGIVSAQGSTPIRPDLVIRIAIEAGVTDSDARSALWYLIEEEKIDLGPNFEITLSNADHQANGGIEQRWRTLRVSSSTLAEMLRYQYGLASDVEVTGVVFDEHSRETAFTLRSATYPVNNTREK